MVAPGLDGGGESIPRGGRRPFLELGHYQFSLNCEISDCCRSGRISPCRAFEDDHVAERRIDVELPDVGVGRALRSRAGAVADLDPSIGGANLRIHVGNVDCGAGGDGIGCAR